MQFKAVTGKFNSLQRFLKQEKKIKTLFHSLPFALRKIFA